MKKLLTLLTAFSSVFLLTARQTATAQTYLGTMSGSAASIPNASPGTGTVIVTITGTSMRVQCTFSGLLGSTTAAHIHAATATAGTGTVGVATTTPSFTGFPLGVTSGSYDHTFDMDLSSSYNPPYITANGGTTTQAFTNFVAALNAGKAYADLHTSVIPGGEIRVFLAQCTPPSTPTISPGGATTFCSGGSVTLTSSSATGNQWYKDGNIISLATSATYVATGSGSYTVAVTNGGCSSPASAATTVTVNDLPSTPGISASGATSFCPGGSVTLSATGSNAWAQKTAFGGTARLFAVSFSIGSKGYIGTGSGVGGVKKNDFWEYDPAANTWTQKANFGGGARGGAVGFSIGGKGYLGTGNTDLNNLDDFWEYDPTANTWVQKASFGGSARGAAVGFNIGSKGYIGTGSDGNGYTNDFWEYDPTTDTWTQKADFGGTTRHEAVGFSLGSKGYVGTGYNGNNNTNDFWEYDPAADTWTQKANFGGTARYGAAGFSLGSKGYIGTGADYINGLESDFWEYDPTANSWAQRAAFAGGARFFAGGFSIGGKGYIGMGGDGTNYMNDFWEYTPTPSYSWSPGGQPTSSISATASGSYTVTVTNSFGCSTTSAATTVTVNPTPTAPVISAGGSTTICSGNSVTLQSSSNAGNALLLNGSNQNADLGTWFNYQTFTIEMWVKPGATQQQNADIIDNNHTGSRSWVFQQNSTVTNQYIFGGSFSSPTTFDLTANLWQHLALVSTPTTKSVYVDGILMGSSSGSITYDGTEFLRLGSWGGGGRNWNGEMDEVKIYSTALTQAEIQADMNVETSPSAANLLAYYKMNETTGAASITDASANGLAGTLNNSPAFGASGAPVSYNTFLWSPGGSTGASLSASSAGTYHVTVTNAAGCSATSTDVAVTVTAAPSASISYNGSPYCQGGGTATVALTGTAGGTFSSSAGLSIDANTGDITLGTSTVGTYTVTYTVPASGGCAQFTTTTSVTVVSNAAMSIIYAGDPFCKTGVAFVTRTGGVAGGTYSSDPGMNVNATTGYLYLGYSTVGTHIITYSVSLPGGCAGTASTTITILPLPTITLGTVPTICQNTATALLPYTATTANPTTYSIRADINNPMPNYVPVVNAPLSGGTINLQVPANTPGGTYYFDLTVANAGGCVSPGKYVFAVTIASQASIVISYAGTPFCATGVGLVTRQGAAGGTYTSSPGLSINATSGTIYPAPSIPGNYIVTYTVTLSGCTYTATTNVTIAPIPKITVGTVAPVCISANAQTASVPYTVTANTPVSYSITVGTSNPMPGYVAVTNAALGNPIVVSIPAGAAPGTYSFYLTLKSAGGCLSAKYTFFVTVKALPTATIAYTNSPYASTITASAVSFSGTAGGTYSAAPGLHLNASTGTVFPSASTAGTYTVTYTVTPAVNCTATATAQLTISPAPPTRIVTTTSGKGSVAKTIPVVSLNDKIVIAPNPVERMLNINATGVDGTMQLRITNATGSVVVKDTRFSSSFQLDMSGYAAGVYMVEVVKEKTGEVVRRKVVKR